MIIRAAGRVPGTGRSLFAWWSDYTDGVIDDRSFSKVTRRVVSRDGERIRLEDTFTRPISFVDRTDVQLLPPDRIEFSSDSRVWKAKGRYTFSGEDMAEASVEVELKPQGIFRLLFSLPFVRGRIVREFREDLEGHLREYAAEQGEDGTGN